MKKILTEWRKYLKEARKIDAKIMSQIDKAEEMGLKVKILPSVVTISHPKSSDVVASVSWDDDRIFGDCLGAAFVTGAQAEHGLGPLAYDIAIEKTGGLMADRTEVSDEAEKVWWHYTTKRMDVHVDQLDISKDHGLRQLTPKEPKDDCDQIPAVQKYGNTGDWWSNGLTQKISKMGTPVIDELEKRGMLL